MTVTDDRSTEPASPDAPIAKQVAIGDAEATMRGRRFSADAAFRAAVLVALLAFLGFYVGAGSMVTTLLKVAVAFAISAALFIGANKLFDQAYPRWTVFNTMLGGVIGFTVFLLLDGNRLLRELSPRPWLWAVVGAAALAAVMFLLSAPRQQLARLPLAVAGFCGFGVLTAFATDETVHPGLDWAALLIGTAIGVFVVGGIGMMRGGSAGAEKGAIGGAALGWLIGAWGGADLGAGSVGEALIATVVPAALIGLRIGLGAEVGPTRRRAFDKKARSWIFLVPALTFIAAGLVIPLLRTIYLSFRNDDGSENVGLVNYEDIFTNKNSFNLDNWSAFLTSRLFWIAIGMVGLGIIVGVVSGRRTRQAFEKGEASLAPIFIGLFLISCAVLSTVRGTIFNNIWWVVVVTTLSTAIGLGVAVLADRSKGENIAKSLIFLPMAISFVGAGIIWRFMYIARPESDEQTGVLNSLWVWLGQISTSGAGKAVAVAALALMALGLVLLVRRGLRTKQNTLAGISLGLLLVAGYLIYRFIGPGLGGFTTNEEGVTSSRTILFLQEGPFNNMWLMVVLIWIQSGFAMVILSAAIKAVPTELTEAAKMDGASESQVFWRVTMPQIAPTIGVVVTTLIVTVMKVFDIVKVTTSGDFDTQVVANEMFTRAFGQSKDGLGAALAVVLFVAIIPVMYLNIRRMQRARI
jgi:alpha-glucoside transport system permease protein